MNVSQIRAHHSLSARAFAVSFTLLLACAALNTPAQAASTATITPSFSPNRLGAKGTLTLTIRFAGEGSELPAALRRGVIRFPAGMTIEIPRLHICGTARLLLHGASGCSARYRLGQGYALTQARVGSQSISERIAMWAFLGPPRNLDPTLEILAQGHTPYDQRRLLAGIVLPASAPYGEQLEMSLPAIHTVALEPDASIVTFSLTVGAKARRGGRPSAVSVPSLCPAGGFPFAAKFTYADGSSSETTATAPCPSPRRAAPARAARTANAQAARTVNLAETGRLHLTSKHGFTLNEQGPMSGTITGTLYVRLTLVSSSRANAEVSISVRGGSITGRASASWRRTGSTAGFSGAMSIVRGSGSYSHVQGSGLSFSGTMRESGGDPITVHLSGHVSA